MLEARRLVEAQGESAVSGTVVQAGFQSMGRGRLKDRRWETQEGEGLLFTIIFTARDLKNRMGGKVFTLLPLLCGLSAAEAVEQYIDGCAVAYGKPLPRIQIKWPNDVLADDKKICGILCESSGDYIYAGIGINMNQTEFPRGLRRPASSLRQITGLRADNREVLIMFLQKLGSFLADEGWRELIEARLYGLNNTVELLPAVTSPEGAEPELITGVLTGINSDGALIMDCSGQIRSFVSGELRI